MVLLQRRSLPIAFEVRCSVRVLCRTALIRFGTVVVPRKPPLWAQLKDERALGEGCFGSVTLDGVFISGRELLRLLGNDAAHEAGRAGSGSAIWAGSTTFAAA